MCYIRGISGKGDLLPGASKGRASSAVGCFLHRWPLFTRPLAPMEGPDTVKHSLIRKSTDFFLPTFVVVPSEFVVE